MPAISASAEHERSLSGKRRQSEERAIRKAQKNLNGQNVYSIKKSPFRALACKLLSTKLKSEKDRRTVDYRTSESALAVIRHAVEHMLGTLIVDANNVCTLTTHNERDTVYWTDILAVLASNRGAPGPLREWVDNEMSAFNNATNKRQLAHALATHLHKYTPK